jgi:hypothetical protein
MFADAKIAVFEALRPDIEALPPAHRRRLAQLCRHWADLAEPRPPAAEPSSMTRTPMAGVLLELSRGHRSEE